MAFVNELISETEKIKVGLIGHAQTSQPIPLYKWTVDRGRKTYLIRTGQDRDAPDRVYFRLSIDEMPIDILVIETIEGRPGREDYAYRLMSMSAWDVEKKSRTDTLDLLRDALTTFAGFYGTAKVSSVEFLF